MNTTSVSLTELRGNLGDVVELVSLGEVVRVTKSGQTVAVILDEDTAAWCEALERLFRERRPPFTQANLDALVARIAGGMNLGDLVTRGAR